MTAASRSILRDPAFARLWFIQAATQVGGNMALYALTILVYQTTRSNAAVSALVTSFVLPQIVLSPFAGVIVDRLDLRLALLVPNVARATLMLALALAGANVLVLLALNLGISLTSVALTPAEGSMIARVVPKAQLETAMGVFNLTLQASFAVGFAFLGPLLVTFAGPSTVLAVVFLLYLAASVACIGLPSAPPFADDDAPEDADASTDDDAAPRSRASRGLHAALLVPIRELREGFSVLRHDREVSRPILHQAAAASVAGVLGVLGPSLATAVGLEPDQLVVVVLPLGIGVVVGVLGLQRFGRSLPRRRAAEGGLMLFGLLTVAIGVVATAAAAMGSGATTVLPVVVGLAFVAGITYAVTSVSAQTALFESIPAEVRGRIFGVLASIVSAASLVPTVVAGPLADRVSAEIVIAIIGAMVFGLGVWSVRLFGPKRQRSILH